jgi:hypothetical protein
MGIQSERPTAVVDQLLFSIHQAQCDVLHSLESNTSKGSGLPVFVDYEALQRRCDRVVGELKEWFIRESQLRSN